MSHFKLRGNTKSLKLFVICYLLKRGKTALSSKSFSQMDPLVLWIIIKYAKRTQTYCLTSTKNTSLWDSNDYFVMILSTIYIILQIWIRGNKVVCNNSKRRTVKLKFNRNSLQPRRGLKLKTPIISRKDYKCRQSKLKCNSRKSMNKATIKIFPPKTKRKTVKTINKQVSKRALKYKKIKEKMLPTMNFVRINPIRRRNQKKM